MDCELRLDHIAVPAGRRAVDPDAVTSLKKSIAALGLQHRVTVCKRDDAYVLVAGAHRLEAFRQLGKERIPATVVDFDEFPYRVASLDGAFTADESNDPSALRGLPPLRHRAADHRRRHCSTVLGWNDPRGCDDEGEPLHPDAPTAEQQSPKYPSHPRRPSCSA
jgi:hypothetical protein